VCRHAILLKDEARWQNRSAILNKYQQQGFNIKFSIYFGLVWNEMQSYFPLKQMPADDVFGELCSLSYQPMFIGILI